MSNETESLDQRLIKAAEENNMDIVQKLCAGGASAKFVDVQSGIWGARTSKAAIHCALRHKNIDMVRFLLENGASAEAKYEDFDWRGCGATKTAFDMASRLNEEFVLLFLEHGANPNLESVSETHSMRTDGSAQWRLIHQAVSTSSTVVVEALIKAGADITALKRERYSNERGYNRNDSQNALHIACDKDAANIATLLLEEAQRRGMLKDFINSTRTFTMHQPNTEQSPTDDPRSEGYVSPVVCVQVEETALHVAIGKNNQALVDLLLRHGASTSIPRRVGDSFVDTTALAEQLNIRLTGA